jgi:hypothetical protein
MNRKLLTAALLAGALGLSACDHHEGMVNSKICADFRAVNTAQTGVPVAAINDAATPVDECVRRWAYSLAGDRDDANVVADATVAACAAALTHWNQAGLAQQAQTSVNGPVQALSLTTGEPTTALAEHSNFAHGRALFYVVQARAGRCAPPPVNNGVPVGA